MKYIIAIIVIVVFSVLYVISYLLNSKVKGNYDISECEGCKLNICFHCHKKEEK